MAMRGEDAHFFNDIIGHDHHSACENVPPGIMDHVQCIAPPAPLPQETLEMMPPKNESGQCEPQQPKREYDVNDTYQDQRVAPGGGYVQNPHKPAPLQAKDAFPPALKEPLDPNALRLGTTMGFDVTDPNALLNQPALLGDPLSNPYAVDVGSWGTSHGIPNTLPPQTRRKTAMRGPVDIRKLSQSGHSRGPVDIRKLSSLHDDPNIPPMESGVFPEDKGKKSLAGLPSKLLELGVSKRLTKLDRLSRMDDRHMTSKQKAEKRRLMRLEKNRRAAAISRERKKRYIRSLEERSLIMSKHLQVLEMENSQLRALLAQSTNGQELLDTMPPHMSPLPEMSLGLPTDSELFSEQFGVSSPRPQRTRSKGSLGTSFAGEDSFQGQENLNPMKWADPSELKSVFCPGSRKAKSKKRPCPSDEEDFTFNGAAPVATAGSSTKLSIKLDDPYPTTTLKTENPPKRTRYNVAKDHPPCHRIPKKPKVGYY